MSQFRKHDLAGEASIFIGDPRTPQTDMDDWWNGVLTHSGGARSRPYLYGSDAGLCPRKNVYLEHNTWVPESRTPASTAYMAIGVGLENMLAQALEEKGRLLCQSLRLITMPELKISGKIDLVILDSEDEVALVEVKSCGQLPLEPNPVHLAQIQTYAAVSGLHRAWLTYVSRGVREEYGPRLAIRTFRVPVELPLLTDRLRIAALSAACSKVQKVPPVPPHFRKHSECHYCPFMDFCWTSRPSRGSAPPKSPLEELTEAEYIVLDEEAGLLAEKLMDESYLRLEMTGRELLELSLTPKQVMAVKEMVKGSVTV